MLYLICGEDTYQSRQKLKETLSDPAHGEVITYDASVEDISTAVEESLGVVNLFGVSPTIVILYPASGLPENREWLMKRAPEFANIGAVLILWDSEAIAEEFQKETKWRGRRAGKSKKAPQALRELSLLAKNFFSYPKLANSQLQKYVSEMARAKNLSVKPSEISILAEESRGDLWMIHQELEKYALTGSFDYEKKIAMAEKLFDFMDALAVGDSAEAFMLLESVQEAGFEQPYVLGTMAGMLRNMIKVKSILPLNPDYQKLGSFGMHEFVLKKTLSHIKRFRLEDLKRLYKLVAETDLAIKTGDGDSGVIYARLISAFE